MENHFDYVNSSESIIISSPQINHVTSTSPYPGSFDATFYQAQHSPESWLKIDYSRSQDLPSIISLPIPPYNKRSESQKRADSESQSQRRDLSTIERTRRKLTTKENANFQCNVVGCGKFFRRRPNFKLHMETHNASRDYPFPCPLKDCNKKFVRKIDLNRHHQSVHMKQRNYRCDYCSRYFTRKDTLRRHMEDTCSKCFDIETVDSGPQSYSNSNDQSSMRVTARIIEMSPRKASYSSQHYSPLPGSSTTLGPHDSPFTLASG